MSLLPSTREDVTLQQTLYPCNNLPRAFRFMILFLPTITTPLVRTTASMCRVITTIAVPLALPPSCVCKTVLAPQLKVEKSLLNTQTLGPWMTVSVTDRCRPRFLERPSLFLVKRLLKCPGPCVTNLPVRETLDVLLTLPPEVLYPLQ